MQTKSIDFTGENIYIGLDVHKRSWSVTILSDEVEHKTYTQPPEAEMLAAYLHKNFPGASFHSAYEAGFCGYGHHRELLELGINNMVVNAADVPNTNKERTTKTDKIDSRKIARALRSGMLRPIHVFDREHEQYRSLSRQRHLLQRDLRRYKQRIKSFLMYHHITIPPELDGNNWSLAFERWLSTLVLHTEEGTLVLENLMEGYRFHKNQVRVLSNELRARTRKQHKENYYLLRTIPGIGPLTAIAIIAEIGDMSRFRSIRKLGSYAGIMPMSYSSGETERIGGITYRCNPYLRTMLIESSWVAISKDPALLLYFKQHAGKNPKRAIVKVARKLLARIKYVMDNKQPYVIGVVK